MCSQGSATFEDLSQIQPLEELPKNQPLQDELTTTVTQASDGSSSLDGLSQKLTPSQSTQDVEHEGHPVDTLSKPPAAEKEPQLSHVRAKPDIAAAFPSNFIAMAFPASLTPPLPPGVVRMRPIARAYTTAAAPPPPPPPSQMREDVASQREQSEMEDSEAEQEAARSLMLLGDFHARTGSAGVGAGRGRGIKPPPPPSLPAAFYGAGAGAGAGRGKERKTAPKVAGLTSGAEGERGGVGFCCRVGVFCYRLVAEAGCFVTVLL